MHEHKMSCWQTESEFGLPTRRVQQWERIYLQEGVEGLYVERRGRSCASSGTQKGKSSRIPKQVEEDLIAENQRLRAEVAYLKNLQALVLEDKQHQCK